MAEAMAVTETTIRGFKKAIQDFVAPEIRDLKGEVGKINIRIDSLNTTINTRIDGVETKINGLDEKWTARFDGLENTINARIDGVENRFSGLEKLVATQLDAMNRSVLSALGEIKALIGESQALSKLDTLQKVSALSERVAVLEAARH